MRNEDIIKIIYEKSKGTAPVVIQFGRVINNVCHNGDIIIKKCPPAIIERLVEAGCSIGVCEDGAYVFNLGKE